jgi:hypothetical protein
VGVGSGACVEGVVSSVGPEEVGSVGLLDDSTLVVASCVSAEGVVGRSLVGVGV